MSAFGRSKVENRVRPVLEYYCYRCQRQSAWELWGQTEWLSFFGMKFMPILWTHALVCSGCHESALLSKSQYKKILRGASTASLAAFLENHQLAVKNEVQRAFLQTIRVPDKSSE